MEFTGERMIPEFSDDITFWEHVYRYRFASTFTRGKRVLDIACGEGYGSAGLLKSGAKSVIGVDVSTEVCDYAKSKYKIDIRQGSAESIPLPNDSIDVVVSFETIEHVKNPTILVDECARVLSSHGILILSTPNREIYRASGRDSTYHCSEFSENELEELLKKKFCKINHYIQQPTNTSWYSKNTLAINTSPWFQVKGISILRTLIIKLCCPLIISEISQEIKKSAADLVCKKDGILSSLVNPYCITKRSPKVDEKPIYMVVTAEQHKCD